MDSLRIGHLWNATILVAAAVLALAADQLSVPPTVRPPSIDGSAFGDLSAFATPGKADSTVMGYALTLGTDPLESSEPRVQRTAAASETVAKPAPGARLTAILLADDHRVAVVDEKVVSVGDFLPDGSKVASIQQNRVFLSLKNGQMKMLTLASQGR